MFKFNHKHHKGIAIIMINCKICNKVVFEADKTIVDLDTLKCVTRKGFIPSYYIESEKEGIEYGLPKDRKWKNNIKEYSNDSMEICKSCLVEIKDALESKKLIFL